MKFVETNLEGAVIVELDKHEDDRGFFARQWCQKEFEAAGLIPTVVQANISSNKLKGTLRGMHFQQIPYEETKLIRCTRGALFDVIIDLRAESSTYLEWFGVKLTEENYKMLYVPKGCAHGFQTLVANTEAFYMVSEFYTPSAEGGVRYNDPLFRIDWPLSVSAISDKDLNWPDYSVERDL